MISNAEKNQLLLIKVIKRWLKHKDWEVRKVAMNICANREIPVRLLERGLKDKHYEVREAAMKACIRRDVPLRLLELGLKDEDVGVREATMDACVGRYVPLELLQRGMLDTEWSVRHAAMFACVGKDVAVEMIERWLEDFDNEVREEFLKSHAMCGMPVPTIRQFEPPETVYKKCLGDVIVCASIPKDAHTVGGLKKYCRSSKAVITDVIGTFGGEPVGVSLQDESTTYCKGDEVFVADFDFSSTDEAPGFHFFCLREDAEDYEHFKAW